MVILHGEGLIIIRGLMMIARVMLYPAVIWPSIFITPSAAKRLALINVILVGGAFASAYNSVMIRWPALNPEFH